MEESSELKAFFADLKTDDFDRREHALMKLAAMGPGLLPLIDRYLDSALPQQATLASQLKLRVLLGYDGYFPTAQRLREKLSAPLHLADVRSSHALLRSAAKALDAALVFDPVVRLSENLGEFEALRLQLNVITVAEALALVEALSNAKVLLRGDALVVTTPDTALKVLQQRHIFDWSELRLGRDEAQRVGDALKGFFPADCEIHAAGETLTIRGSEEGIARAARLLEALKPGEGGVLCPLVKIDTAALLKELQAPVDLHLNSEDPIHALDLLQKSGHAVHGMGFSGALADPAKLPPELRGAAPAKLVLSQVPLAFALHWVGRCTRFITADLDGCSLVYDLDSEGRKLLRVKKKLENPTALGMLGIDAGFLYPRNAKPSAAVDAEVKQKALTVLKPHLDLLPALDLERDLVVLRGRLFMQGSAPALLYMAQTLHAWKTSGQAPPPPPFHAALEAKLDATYAWDGRGLTAGRLLPTFRALAKVNFRLEDGPDGRAPNFELTRQDAQLLPAGPQTLRALLDELGSKAGAVWSVEFGAIVLRPKAAKP